MGVMIIILAFYSIFQIPWDSLRRLGLEELGWSLFISSIILISLGMTEVAVAWLVGKHLE